jgi:MYXO-CTERM domain-containing protein
VLRVRVRVVAAAVLAAAAYVASPVPPASAAGCATAHGVTVVVEYGALGGGTDVDCEPEGGGRTADRLLKDAGHALAYVQRFPGFVCRVDGVPADDPCVNTPPADAYWGLWWSDGKTGKWSYASLGASSLNIPAGGYVAMVWDGTSGDVRPSTAATPHRAPPPTPTPTKRPTTQAPSPTAAPTAEATTATPSQDPIASPSNKPSATPAKTKKPEPTRTASATPEPSAEQTEAGAAVDDPVVTQSTTDDGLPPWIAPLAVVLLLGAAGAVALARRRRQP